MRKQPCASLGESAAVRCKSEAKALKVGVCIMCSCNGHSGGGGMPGTEFPATPSRLSGASISDPGHSQNFLSIPHSGASGPVSRKSWDFPWSWTSGLGSASGAQSSFKNALCHGNFQMCPAVKNTQWPEGHPQIHSDAGHTLPTSMTLPTPVVTL